MKSCKKCGSDDLNTTYREEGKLINSSSAVKIDNEFIHSSEYRYFYQLVSAKEHLSIFCRNCQYEWQENTKDNS